MKSDPCNLKDDQKLKEDRGSYKNYDSCNNLVDETTYIVCNPIGRKHKIRLDSSCISENLIHVAYPVKYMKQSVFQLHLGNHAYRITKASFCRIV